MPSKFHLIYQLALLGAADVLPHAVRDQALGLRVRGRLKRESLEALSDVVRNFNGALFLNSPDRTILENVVLPFYQLSSEHNKIVFIGTEWYTAGYARMFSHKSLWTLDRDERKARFGAPQHLVSPMKTIAHQFAPGSVDLVVCNGVVGWGLDTLEECEHSFAAAATVLRPGGHLIVGFNDRPPHIPVRLEEIDALKSFEPFAFEPLAASEHRVDHELRHVFRFYRKPDTRDDQA